MFNNKLFLVFTFRKFLCYTRLFSKKSFQIFCLMLYVWIDTPSLIPKLDSSFKIFVFLESISNSIGTWFSLSITERSSIDLETLSSSYSKAGIIKFPLCRIILSVFLVEMTIWAFKSLRILSGLHSCSLKFVFHLIFVKIFILILTIFFLYKIHNHITRQKLIAAFIIAV